MSVALELSRIQTDRNTIRTKLIELGLASSVDNLDALASAIEGIVNCGNISATVKEGDTFKIPQGYHDGTGTVSGIKGGGNYKLQSKKIIPTKSQQTVRMDEGYYGLSDVTVEAIPVNYQDVSSVTATPEEVLTGKVYVTSDGKVITGMMADNGAINSTIDVTSINYTIPAGFHNGKGTVKVIIENKAVTPTKETQTVTPTKGKVLSSVTVNPIPAEYQDVTQVNATAENVLVGKKIVSSTGEVIEGGMPDNGDTTRTINGLNVMSVSVPAGYTSGGTISLTNDIEEQLATI